MAGKEAIKKITRNGAKESAKGNKLASEKVKENKALKTKISTLAEEMLIKLHQTLKQQGIIRA